MLKNKLLILLKAKFRLVVKEHKNLFNPNKNLKNHNNKNNNNNNRKNKNQYNKFNLENFLH